MPDRNIMTVTIRRSSTTEDVYQVCVSVIMFLSTFYGPINRVMFVKHLSFLASSFIIIEHL